MQEASAEQGVSGAAAEPIVEADHSAGTSVEGRGQLRKDISNAMVGIKKTLYGKGPVKAKTFINDNIVFCVLEGGLTRNEETMLKAGEERLVREFRLRFQEAVAIEATTKIEDLTGRKVL